MSIVENEVGKYRKKKESNTSKAKYKSKHKHQYKSCLIRYYTEFMGDTHEHISIASYCIICGKIGSNIDSNRKITEKTENGFYRMLTKEEILKNNNDISIFNVSDCFAKYVVLDNIR